MKKIGYLLIPLFCLYGGYWYGVKVGGYQAQLNVMGAEALDSIAEIRMLKAEEYDELLNSAQVELNENIINFGRHLENRYRIIPGLYDVQSASEWMYAGAIEFRLENPRIVDGVEFSPFNPNYHMEDMPENVRNDVGAQIEQKKKYYLQALEWGKSFKGKKASSN